ncbi:LamG-like jellyroll fold domain-containing protein [Thalassospira sp. MCCC 1A01428]|uniref:LamG-like jellyroll fold domain-containing protein n=1 Tax=Thalassospira sp. MCCC 1A01428 TaxID=1470575 RepID=UPI000A1DA56B|nr:LamG-like jellyroll fold domain-containing protein [Thalassospira sp. MCCC 1A01428]OSQ43954.1 hypothetical protein THS27_09105 [Thalassospira sp. MCCC 1A01428]
MGSKDIAVVGQDFSILKGEKSWVYKFINNHEILIARNYVDLRNFVFSIYVKCYSHNEDVVLIVRSKYFSNSKKYRLTKKWQRISVPVDADFNVELVEIYLFFPVTLKQFTVLSCALPQLEKGIKPSSPIPPDSQLPIIQLSKVVQSKCPMRAADILSIDFDKMEDMSEGVSTISCSFEMIFKIVHETKQILDDMFLTALSFYSRVDQDVKIVVGVSGSRGCRFVVKLYNGDEEKIYDTAIVAANQVYHVFLTFDNNNCTLYVNGFVALLFYLDSEIVFNKCYIGSDKGENSIDGLLRGYGVYRAPLLYQAVLHITKEKGEVEHDYNFDFMEGYFKYALGSKDERDTFSACLGNEGFSFLIRNLEFSLPQVIMEYSGGRKFTEDQVRDFVWALISRPSSVLQRERYSRPGRSDLVVCYPDTYSDKYNSFPVEFKIWGRAGYKDAPSQPLKYLNEDELCGVFVMLDRRKNADISDFEKIVSENEEYPCVSIRYLKILETDLRYFISFHRTSRFNHVKMMINVYLPLS